MPNNTLSNLPTLVKSHEDAILREWVRYQMSAMSNRNEFLSESAVTETSREFLNLFVKACQSGEVQDVQAAAWNDVRSMLSDLSSSRALQGFSPAETATFVFSLKQPLFDRLFKETKDSKELSTEVWTISTLLDRLGLFTFEVFSKSREGVIKRQQQEMMELSTPVVKLWDKIVAVPLIGTLDSARTQTIMEALLTQIVDTGSKVAILDITGVPTVDTQTAQHLIKTVSAARLMGAECIISGIRPQIAQTIVHLGIEIHDIRTKATMADAVQEALGYVGYAINVEMNGASHG